MEKNIKKLKMSENQINKIDFQKKIIKLCEKICKIQKIKKFIIYNNECQTFMSEFCYFDNNDKKIKIYYMDDEDQKLYYSDERNYFDLINNNQNQIKTKYITKNNIKFIFNKINNYIDNENKKNNDLLELNKKLNKIDEDEKNEI